MSDLVAGVHAGGTTTRPRRRSGWPDRRRGNRGGREHPIQCRSPQERFARALAAALVTARPADVRAGVFGVAGAGAAGARTVAEAVDRAWRSVGLGGQPKVVTDLDVAFATGSTSPAGLLLLAGTGAAAAAFADRRIVRRCDGYGWVLGDEGSAVWLGLHGVRAALAAWDGRGR